MDENYNKEEISVDELMQYIKCKQDENYNKEEIPNLKFF